MKVKNKEIKSHKKFMVKFDFVKFLMDKRISAVELAKVLRVSYQSIITSKKRNTIKINILRRMEDIYGNLNNYIS